MKHTVARLYAAMARTPQRYPNTRYQERNHWMLGTVCVTLLGLGGCATQAVHTSFEATQAITEPIVNTQPVWWTSEDHYNQARAHVDQMLNHPLSAEDAQKAALIGSRVLQTALSEHAARVAELKASARLPNPTFAFERLVQGEVTELTRVLSIGLTEFMTWPQRKRMAQAQEHVQALDTAEAIVQVAADAHLAWVHAVAAQQSLRYYENVHEAALAATMLARKMEAAGNFNRLDRARQQAFYADAITQRARARTHALAMRERLIRALSLDRTQAQRLTLPDQLPDLPQAPGNEQAIAARALENRLDLRLAQARLNAEARALGLTRVTHWIDGMHLAGIEKVETNDPQWRGFELSLPLPLFDWGDAKRLHAQARYMAHVNEVARVAIEAQSHVAEAYQAYRATYDIARHYRDEIIPLQKTISEENLYRYNGMLIGVFDLLADARAQAVSVIAAIDATREFWIAHAQLENTLIGRPTHGALAPPTARAENSGGAH